MSNYELIAFDMDGTLLNSKKELLPSSVCAITEATDAGKTVVLCTGRSVDELRAYLGSLTGVRYAVCTNGALVYDFHEEKVIHSRPIPKETVLRLFEITDRMDVMIQLMSIRSYIQADKQARIEEYHAEAYKRLFEDTAEFPDKLSAYYAEHLPEAYKFTPYCRTVEDRDAILPILRSFGLETAYAEATGIESSAPGVSKGYGLRALCEYLHIPMEHVIAVGDADNDLPMLRIAGLPVAMGNANENVRMIAKAVVSDHNSGGCAEVIRNYLCR